MQDARSHVNSHKKVLIDAFLVKMSPHSELLRELDNFCEAYFLLPCEVTGLVVLKQEDIIIAVISKSLVMQYGTGKAFSILEMCCCC